jgi:hypothetical protein
MPGDRYYNFVIIRLYMDNIVNYLSEQQKQIIIDFAFNYSIKAIIRKNKIKKSVVLSILNSLEKNYPVEFENACSIRRSMKYAKRSLLSVDYGLEEHTIDDNTDIREISDNII